MANIVYRQMPAPRRAAQQIPAPRATAWMQKPQGGDKFLVQIPGGERGGGVMDETDTCIILKPKFDSVNHIFLAAMILRP